MVFWLVTPCNSEIARRFGGNDSLHLQGRRVSQARNQLSLTPDSAGLLLDLLFDPEDRGGMFLRNVALSQSYMAIQPRRVFIPDKAFEAVQS
jgi:hypothetical protein